MEIRKEAKAVLQPVDAHTDSKSHLTETRTAGRVAGELGAQGSGSSSKQSCSQRAGKQPLE